LVVPGTHEFLNEGRIGRIEMRPWKILCLFVLLSSCSGEEFIFFADDHYKAVGMPLLNASPMNAVLSSGEGALEIALANNGHIEELIPMTGGSPEDIALEMQEEMHSADALNITAQLEGRGPVAVTAAVQHIPLLPSGALADLAFNLSVGQGAGWQDLWLNLDYERQMDVSVSNGTVSPLYQPESSRQRIRVLVQGAEGPELLGAISDLVPGGSGELSVAIKNAGSYSLENCTARLKAAPPISSQGTIVSLGDLPAGGLAVASFALDAAKDASLDGYQLACEISYENGTASLMVPLALHPPGWRSYLLPALAVALGAAALMLWWRWRLGARRRRRLR
jgi:hypothetical protein